MDLFPKHSSPQRRPALVPLAASVLLLFLALLPGLEAQEDPSLPVVYILGTGGTIAGTGEPGELTGYESGQISAEELVAAVPQLEDYARVRAEQIVNVESSFMTAKIWIELANRINELFRQEDPEVAGVVVPHGTWTLEETAYFLNLTVNSAKPVVLVGAQRPPTAISADGPLNLLNAVRVAADPGSRNRGAMVVMNEQINAARDVRKSDTYRVDAFRSGDLGLLGYVDADRIAFYRSPEARHTHRSEFDVTALDDLPRVAVVMSHTEASRVTLDALVREGYDGIVLHGHGSGIASPELREALAEVGERIPVIRTAQAPNSRVLDAPGWEGDITLAADNLQPLKARILLRIALAHTRDREELRRILREY